MQTSTLLSVLSTAVVAAALSSSFVQLQPTAVEVGTVKPLVVSAPAPADQPPPAGSVAAPAQPAYVQVDQAAPALVLEAATGAAPPTVDVLACSTPWSATGQCLGTQAAVLRDVVVAAVQGAVPVPEGVPHLRVSAHGGRVSVGVTAP